MRFFFVGYIFRTWVLGHLSNWARPWENVSYAICEQQRRRSACASAQSDQRLCCSLPRQNDTSSLYIRNFKILVGFCSWAGQFVSSLVGDSRRHIFSWRGSITSPVYNSSSSRLFKYKEHLSLKVCNAMEMPFNMLISLRWITSTITGIKSYALK